MKWPHVPLPGSALRPARSRSPGLAAASLCMSCTAVLLQFLVCLSICYGICWLADEPLPSLTWSFQQTEVQEECKIATAMVQKTSHSPSATELRDTTRESRKHEVLGEAQCSLDIRRKENPRRVLDLRRKELARRVKGALTFVTQIWIKFMLVAFMFLVFLALCLVLPSAWQDRVNGEKRASEVQGKSTKIHSIQRESSSDICPESPTCGSKLGGS